MTKPVVLNATVFWANLVEPNEMSGKYQVDLGELSPAAVEKLTQLGIDVKYKEGLGDYITCKSQREIHAYSKDTGDNIAEMGVGNGSKAIASIAPYAWKWKGKEGVSPSLRKLVVTDLVTLDGDAADFDLDEAL